MLLELQNTNQENLNKLMAYARQNHLQLSVIDDAGTDYFLPGKPLSEKELNDLIERSRKSGVITMEAAHQAIRNNYHAG